jgi:hypothetical protein
MNGENEHLRHASAPDGAGPGREALPPHAWRWIALGQLWMLAGFTGLSLVVIALLSFFHGGAGHGRDALLATALAGALLIGLAWRGVAAVLQRAESDDPRGPGRGAHVAPHGAVSSSPASTPAAMTGITPSWR